MTIFTAARLLLAYSNTYNPNIDSTFVKLNSVVPPPLRDQVDATISWMQKLERNDHLRRIMDTLANAWIKGRKVFNADKADAVGDILFQMVDKNVTVTAMKKGGKWIISVSGGVTILAKEGVVFQE